MGLNGAPPQNEPTVTIPRSDPSVLRAQNVASPPPIDHAAARGGDNCDILLAIRDRAEFDSASPAVHFNGDVGGAYHDVAGDHNRPDSGRQPDHQS